MTLVSKGAPLAFLWVMLASASAATVASQSYEPPPQLDVQEPAGNGGLDTVSYDVRLTLLGGEWPIEATTTLVVKNVDDKPKTTVNLYLHAELTVDSVAAPGGNTLEFARRTVEYWASTTLLAQELTVSFSDPLAPGESSAVVLTYRGPLNASTARGSRSDGYIGVFEDHAFLRSFPYAAWLPLIHTGIEGTADQVEFTLDADVPESLRLIAPGKRESEVVSSGRRRTAWASVRPMTLAQHHVWAEPWKVLSKGPITAYYHRSADAARSYLDTCAEIKRHYDAMYSVGLPSDSVDVPYSVAELSVPSGGYASQNMVGFARERFTGEFSFADLRWISHEMIHEYLDYPVDTAAPGAVAISDGFNLFFNLPVMEKIVGPSFREWDLERRWRSYEEGLAGKPDREGPLPPEKPLAEITLDEYSYYKDRFLTADKEQIILWRLMDMLGEESFMKGFQSFLREHRKKPATLEAFRKALERESGQNLEAFFHQWFYTTQRLPGDWRPD